MESIALALATPGFRFYPTEEELVSFYLYHKLEGSRLHLIRAMDCLIPVLDVFLCNPWDLPQLAGEVCRGEQEEEWFFFNPIQEKESEGGRGSRKNRSGYWKSTGSPSYVYSSDNRCIGLKRTMVFYNGRARNGSKTDWIINQYKAIHSQHHSSSSPPNASNRKIRQELSLCRVYKTPKCRRSFDRRPMGLYAGEPSVAHPQLLTQEEEERRAPPNTLMVDETTTVTDHSSTTPVKLVNNGCLPSQTEHTNLMANIRDNEPLWDWEHLFTWDFHIYGFGH